MSAGLELFSTCPQSKDPHQAYQYRRSASREVAALERAGRLSRHVGLHRQWARRPVGRRAARHLRRHGTPLPARGGPTRIHAPVCRREDRCPRYGHVYGRRVYLNMVAGGFRNDLHLARGRNDRTTERYGVSSNTRRSSRSLHERRACDLRWAPFYTVRNVTAQPGATARAGRRQSSCRARPGLDCSPPRRSVRRR